MNDAKLMTLQTGQTTLSGAAIEALAIQERGRVLAPDDPGYDEARTIWNAMTDRRPALIVQCFGCADVIHAVELARDNNLLVAVKGGGHNIAGHAVCDGGLMIDLSPMNHVRVDLAAGCVRVGPGATLADIDKETSAFGMVVPTGINSTTGVGGLTLGGGFGWLTRKYGLTLDCLMSCDVVTADGRLLRASETENSDLFWALRGGGGNFGIVTSFEFKLNPLGRQIMAGLVVHPFADARHVLAEYRKALEAAPDELTCWAVMRKAPPLPFLPAEWHGKEILALAMCYCGGMAIAEEACAQLRGIGQPIADIVAPMPFTQWQQAFDPLLEKGARNYWKSHDFASLSDATIDMLLQAIGKLPGPECEIFIGHVGGAAGRVPSDATAFPQRSSHFVMNVHARWRDASMDKACIAWARDLYEKAKPHAIGTAYINFMPADETDRVEAAYGGNYQRLSRIKKIYDPQNMFRMNQNISPDMGMAH
ncbi:FAD-binding oxidoreductase [Neorhizobium sp. IRAMC:178]|uniref:FAD-binding oxidoreductase n=1 Tax=Neorhizobium tunisiense TaxID=3144793 RepID=UPI0031F63A5A